MRDNIDDKPIPDHLEEARSWYREPRFLNSDLIRRIDVLTEYAGNSGKYALSKIRVLGRDDKPAKPSLRDDFPVLIRC